jgi:hypothetical protein
MSVVTMPKTVLRLVLAVFAAGTLLCSAAPVLAQPLFPPGDLTPAAPQGFGDRNNSHAWSMIWWKGKLFVGTGRATLCVQAATLAYFKNGLKSYYPPHEADVDCPADPHDLQLRAEIWQWDPTRPPETAWKRVHQSDNDVRIDGTNPVKYTARDIGYRGAVVFTEADGTEALYIAADSTRAAQGNGIDGPVPPPQILRSTDGEVFRPIPFDPDAMSTPACTPPVSVSGFRSLKSYNGKLYVVASVGQLGHGVILEAEHPEDGAFRVISPPCKTFFEIETYNGFLWAGTGVQPTIDDTPFSLLKTDASGDLPYTFTTVIPPGAYKKKSPSPAVISLHVFKGRLYLGTDRELLRVNPDDTWDLIVGTPRATPEGRKLQPLSGFDVGFDDFFNIHVWRIDDYSGWLYVGTQDQSTKWRNASWSGFLKPRMGFDLYATSDGWHYSMITRTGFGDKLNNGMRNYASTPYGLFMGTANHYYGTQIWRGANRPSVVGLPQQLEAETGYKIVGLTWTGSPTAARFHVFRDSGFGDPQEIGMTDTTLPTGRSFVDKTVKPAQTYHYYVVAEDSQGNFSEPSNMVGTPVKSPIPTFQSLQNMLAGWSAPATLTDLLAAAKTAVTAHDWVTALAKLGTMAQMLATPGQKVLPAWRAEDTNLLLAKFMRRVGLAQAGALPPRMLMK